MPPRSAETAFDRDIGGEKQSRRPDGWLAVLADAQHGVVSRQQLTAAGLGRAAIDHRVWCRRLHLVHRGVYAVGRPGLSREGRWMAAVLAGGNGAALSHRSAAELWGLLRPSERQPEVTARRSRRRLRTVGITWHSGRLPADEVTVLDAIPVTTVARTLLDLAAVTDARTVETAMNEAEVRRYADSPSLPALLDRYPGRRGAATIRSILAAGEIGLTTTKSELEERFLRFVRRRGLPQPELNAPLWVRGRFFEADCLWRRQRVIVELDSRGVHGTAEHFETDRLRDRIFAAEGWQVIRVTWRQLHYERAALESDVRALLALRNRF